MVENTANGFVDYEPEVKENEYAPIAEKLIELGEGKAYKVTIPAADENKHRVAFQSAAKALGKTGLIKTKIIEAPTVTEVKRGTRNFRKLEGGTVELTMRIVEPYKRGGRKPVEPVAEDAKPVEGKRRS